MRGSLRILAVLLVISTGCLFAASCGPDDNDAGSDGGDPGDDADDDYTGDDDTGDDDTGDDDDQAGPYDGMEPAGRTVGEILAVASHMSTGAAYDRPREHEIERSVEAGVSWVRRGFYWSQIEPEDDAWQFDGYDAMVGLLTEAGLGPVAMLTRGVDWAMPDGSPSSIDPANFGDFAGTVAARYADEIDRYEIWNEQNTSRFWSPEADPQHYGYLLKAAYTAVHENDASAEVLFGGLSPLDDNLLDGRGIWNFIARVGEYHPDLCQYLDGAAIHPYTFLQQPGPESSVDLGNYHYPDLRGSIEEARGLLDALGCSDAPIHLTEIGWPSLLIGNARQAAYLARGVLLASAAGAASFHWYTFYDEEPDSDIPTEDYFGLFELPGEEGDPAPKPSYLALLGLSEQVAGARFAGDLGAALGWDSHLFALAFADDAGAWTLALWTAEAPFGIEETVVVPLHPRAEGSWTLYDQEGSELMSGAIDGPYLPVVVSGRVQYLRFDVPASRKRNQK